MAPENPALTYGSEVTVHNANGTQSHSPAYAPSSSPLAGIIIGSVFGAIIALFIVVYLVQYLRTRKAQKSNPTAAAPVKDIETASTSSEETGNGEFSNVPITTHTPNKP